MPNPQTVPCQYKTGRTLGSGTYAVVKEAVHITTGQYYACKVISKRLMQGREHMVRNEISILKRISIGHPNICTLRDHFETAHNLYLVFDLCTGGELFDRICSKGNYYERDAAQIVRTITSAVQYLHEQGIVHRDLKPENLLFRSKADDAELCVADFGLSRILEDDTFNVLTTTCGTPGYMAPEIFKKAGHGKPVDIWAIGVITYFLLCGYTPFDRETQYEEMQAIIRGDFKFEPREYWQGVTEKAKSFVRKCLTVDPTNRPTATELLKDPWLDGVQQQYAASANNETAGAPDLLPHVKKAFDARKTFRKAVIGMMAMHRLQDHHSPTSAGANSSSQQSQSQSNPEKEKMQSDLDEYKKQAEEENVKDVFATS